MLKENISVDEINKLYEDEMKVLKAIDDNEREIEAKAIIYLSTGKGSKWKIGKQIAKIIKRYEEEKPKCEKLPYCSGLITDSIDEEINRLDNLIDEIYDRREES